MDIPFDNEDACPCCPHDHSIKDHTSTNLVLKKICLLFNDAEARTTVHRHIRLINHYIGLSKCGIRLADIPYVTVVFEFLCENLSEVEEYRKPLSYLTALCQCPPLVDSILENMYAPNILADFYAGLGNCIIYLLDSNQQGNLIEIIHNWLTFDTKMNPKYVSLPKRREAMEASKFPSKLGDVLQIIPSQIYNQLLDLILQISVTSNKCTQDLLDCNCLQYLINGVPLQESDNLTILFSQEHTRFLMWQLLNFEPSIHFKNMAPLSLKCLLILRKWFRKEVLKGKPHIRNDILALICKLVHISPYIEIVQSGLVEDICLLAVATEFGLEGSWANNIKLSSSTLDFEFKKLLISTVACFIKYSAAVLIFKEFIVIESITSLMHPCEELKFPWTPSQTLELLTLALHCLPLMAKFMPEEFILCNAPKRLIHLIAYFSKKVYNLEVLRCCLHCFYFLSRFERFIETFRNCCAHQALADLLSLLMQQQFTLLLQQTLSYSILTLDMIDKDNIGVNDCQLVNISISLLKRLLNPNENDFKIDHCLLINLAVFTGDLVILNKVTRKEFINRGGVFLIIDIIYTSIYPIQMVYLSLLVDLTEDDSSIAQLMTWRGKKKEENLIHFLCNIWRKQERKIGVGRDSQGCILDIEQPLMGQNQQMLLHKKSNLALLDMYCCVRPKIYAIINLIFNHHQFSASVLDQTYGMPYRAELIEDKISLKVIEFYECLKEGEIWWQLWRPIQRNQATLLPMSANLKHHFSMKHIQWASQIHREQMALKESLWKQTATEEEKLYKHLKLCRLGNALTALRKLEYEIRVSNHKELEEAKTEQVEKIFNKSHTSEKETENKEVIYLFETNVTTIKTGRNCLLTSIKGPRKYMELKKDISI